MDISVHQPKTFEFSQDLLTKKKRNQNEAFKMSSIGVQTRLNRFWIEFEFRLWASLYISPVYGASLPYCRKKKFVGRGGPPGEMLSVFLLGLFICFHFVGIGFGLNIFEFEMKFINLQAQQNGNLGPPTQKNQISLGFAYSKKRNQTWSFQNDLNWSSNVFESSFDRVWIEFELIFELRSNWVWILFLSFALNSMTRL